MPSSRRLAILLHVPELSLVVIGAGIGRVLLMTPTRVRGAPLKVGRESSPQNLKYGYRIDHVLPRAREEARREYKTALYGVAIGPVQEGSGATGQGSLLLRPSGPTGKVASGPGRRRFRLMLHFRDHSIMSYEVGRDEEGSLQIM